MQSTQRSTRDEFLRGQMKKMAALRFAPTEKEAVQGITEQWERILVRIGEMRFAATVKKCLETLEYFPSVPEFEEKIPAGDVDAIHPRCAKCRDNEGWLLIRKPHPWNNNTHIVAVRCKHD